MHKKISNTFWRKFSGLIRLEWRLLVNEWENRKIERAQTLSYERAASETKLRNLVLSWKLSEAIEILEPWIKITFGDFVSGTCKLKGCFCIGKQCERRQGRQAGIICRCLLDTCHLKVLLATRVFEVEYEWFLASIELTISWKFRHFNLWLYVILWLIGAGRLSKSLPKWWYLSRNS